MYTTHYTVCMYLYLHRPHISYRDPKTHHQAKATSLLKTGVSWQFTWVSASLLLFLSLLVPSSHALSFVALSLQPPPSLFLPVGIRNSLVRMRALPGAEDFAL